jgi:hypothetical protein
VRPTVPIFTQARDELDSMINVAHRLYEFEQKPKKNVIAYLYYCRNKFLKEKAFDQDLIAGTTRGFENWEFWFKVPFNMEHRKTDRHGPYLVREPKLHTNHISQVLGRAEVFKSNLTILTSTQFGLFWYAATQDVRPFRAAGNITLQPVE